MFITLPFAEALAAGTAAEPLFSVLAQAKILNGAYGTRCSTVFFGRRYAERSFAADGSELDTLHYELRAASIIAFMPAFVMLKYCSSAELAMRPLLTRPA